MKKTIPAKQVKEFLQWLDYEHNIIECYGYDTTAKDLKNSHRIIYNRHTANVYERISI